MITTNDSQISKSMESGEILEANHRAIRQRNKDRAPAIFGLLGLRCPNAVAWLIVSVVIQALYLLTSFFQPHVSEKIGIAIDPAFAYFYAATAIILVCRVVFIEASGLHSHPRTVLAGYFPASRMPMDFRVTSKAKAATGIGSAISKLATCANAGLSAIAGAFPGFMSLDDSKELQNYELAEAHPSQISFGVHS